jgi:hypothetical protein
MTKTGRSWFSVAAAKLRPDQVQILESTARRISDQHHAPRIGGNHVLEALLETNLYSRAWPV